MRSLLVIITSDPRTSHRPAEAIRTMAGVASWKKIAISVYLRGTALLCLGEEAEDLVGGQGLPRYAALLAENATIYGETGAELKNPSPGVRVQAIDEARLAELAADATYVARF